MIDFVRRQPVMLALAAIVALLLVVIAVEAQIGARLRAQAAPGAGKVAAAEPKLLPMLAVAAPEQAYPQTAARPLFTPTRRPAPPVEVAQQQAFQPGQFVLLGVTIAGNTRIALLREKANGRIHRVEKGGEVNGIKIAEIDPESVKLAQGGSSEVVQLTVQKAMAGAQAAQLGPFGGPGAAGPGGFPIGAPGVQGATAAQPLAGMPPNPAAPPAPAAAGAPFGPLQTQPGATPPQAQQQPAQSAVPMTPEELLARRRARRTQTQ
jgi:general secretion pathway protein N